MERPGQWSAAFETFGKSLRLLIPWRMPNHYSVIDTAHHMKRIQQLQADQAQSLSATPGDHQNERREDPWAADQEESGIDQQQSETLG